MNRKSILLALGAIILVMVALVPRWQVEASKPVPIIVDKHSFINQTASIGSTTLFTPSADGDYRLTVSIVGYVVNCNSGGARLSPGIFVGWTDELKSESAELDLDVGSHCSWDAKSVTFHAASGNPITISTHVDDSAAGNYYFTLEEL